MNNCSFSSLDACHQLTHSRSKGLKKVAPEDKEILELRSKISRKNIKTICNHHEAKLVNQFSSLIKKCSNPFELHSAVVTKSLKIISFEIYSKTTDLQHKAVPGEKLCVNCYKRAKELQHMSAPSEEEEKTLFEKGEVCQSTGIQDAEAGPSGLQQIATASSSSTSTETCADLDLLEVNQTLQILGETPVKTSKNCFKFYVQFNNLFLCENEVYQLL